MISPRATSSLLRGVRSMATVRSTIGETKVPMSHLETNKFINYQRIEDNLQVVRAR